MSTAAFRLLTEGGGGRELPVAPWVFGLGAFAFLVALLLLTLSFGKDR